ncbi:MAG: lipocalin-like domain-containing protein [Bacteroidota bacterium]
MGFLVIILFQFSSAQSLQFPQDEGKHNGVDFESWSLLAHLSGQDSGKFGIAIFFFRGKIIGLNASGVYVVVVDEEQQTFNNYQKVQLPLINRATHTRGRLMEKYGRNVVKRDPEGGPYQVAIDIKDFKLNLLMDPSKALIDVGRIAVGSKRYTRSYAAPRGRVSGRMQYQGKETVLSGIGLFQHQWGDTPEKYAASNMFVVHLDDGADIIAYYSDRFPDINNLVLSDNKDIVVSMHDFNARPDTLYTVDATRDRFELGWKIESEMRDLSLFLKPSFDGQEISMLGTSYWLARCQVEGCFGGQSQSGIGYIYIREAGR